MATNGIPDEPSNRQEAVALALAGGQTVRDAAKATDVGERTIHRWLAEDAAFRRRVSELRDAMYSAAVGRLADLTGTAAEVLGELLESQADNVRLAAARTILEQAVRMHDHADLLRRLDALEQRDAARGPTA